MRIRIMIAVVLCAALGLAGCSSTKSPAAHTTAATTTATTPATVATSPLPSITASGASGLSPYCTQLVAAGEKLAGFAGQLSNPSSLPAYLTEVVAALNALKQGAPSSVASAINDLISVINAHKNDLNNPQAIATIATQLAPRLQADDTTIGNYINTNCKG